MTNTKKETYVWWLKSTQNWNLVSLAFIVKFMMIGSTGPPAALDHLALVVY